MDLPSFFRMTYIRMNIKLWIPSWSVSQFPLRPLISRCSHYGWTVNSMFLSCASKMSIRTGHFTLNFQLFQWAVCLVSIETKQSENKKASCHRMVENLAKGRVGWGLSTRHSPPYKSVLDSNTSVVHIWSIASAQPTLCQLQLHDLILFRRQPYPRLTNPYMCAHTRTHTINHFYVFYVG